MAAKRHPPRSPAGRADQDERDRGLDAWLDRALGARRPEPDPKPAVHDL